jgi:hypothetical protein
MPLLADRVRETSATTGTGTLTLAGAVAGYQGFNAAFANGDTVYYVIQYATEWEVGIGTVGTGTLARNTVLQSSNGDALVPFSAGTKDVFCAYVAERAVTTSDAATLTNKTIDDYTNNIGANSTHFRVKASESLSKGAVVKASGFTPGEQAITVAAVASASDIAIGVMEQTLTSGQFGMAVVIGELFDVNTNAFAFNDVLYSNGAGGLTATKPASGLYQTIGTVVRVNTNNGVIAVNIVAPMYVEATTNTANTAVLRDGSGNFAAGTVTAALTGNASTATALATARNINGVSFNGTSDITVTAAAGTLTGSTLAAGVTASSLTSVGTLGNLTVTNPISGSVSGSSGSTTGNAATATALQTARAINGVNFDGTAAITVTAAAGTLSGSTLAAGVTASSLTSVGTLGSLTVTNPITGSVTGSSGSTTGNAATATALQTARNINGVSFNGSADITVTAAAGTLSGSTLASGVTASSLTSVGTLSSLAVSGSLTVDTNTLFVDAGNNRVGVNCTPVVPAQIRTQTNGNVGFQPATVLSGGNKINNFNDAAAVAVGLELDASAHALLIAGTEALRVDASRNLGLGVTPSAWDASIFRTMQIGSGAGSASLSGRTDGTKDMVLGSNLYYGTGSFRYVGTGTATAYRADGGEHSWLTAPSGTAGNAISFVQALTLHASGGHSLGTTTDPGAGVFLANTGVQAPRLSTATATSFGSALAATAYRIYADATYGAAIAGFGTTSDVTLIGRGGNLLIQGTDNGGVKIGFYGTSPQAKQTVTGSRGSNAALTNLLTVLANLGLLTDSTT